MTDDQRSQEMWVCLRCSERTSPPVSIAVVCAACGYVQSFQRQPLLVITGASGVGKSLLCALLAPQRPDLVCLESDVLWGAVPATAEDGYRSYWGMWLRLASAVGQSGRPVALFDTTLPAHLEAAPYREGLATIHYLALVCDDAVLAARLTTRPAWRGCDDAFIAQAVAFNDWLRTHAHTTTPPIALLDMTALSPEAAAQQVGAWLSQTLGSVSRHTP